MYITEILAVSLAAKYYTDYYVKVSTNFNLFSLFFSNPIECAWYELFILS